MAILGQFGYVLVMQKNCKWEVRGGAVLPVKMPARKEQFTALSAEDSHRSNKP